LIGIIRNRYANGESAKKLGKEYGVHVGNITKALKYKRWAHVQTSEAVKVDGQLYEKGARHHNSKLTDEIVLKIRLDAGMGMTHKDIAKKYGIGQPATTRIINRKRWAHI
jgi:transposase